MNRENIIIILLILLVVVVLLCYKVQDYKVQDYKVQDYKVQDYKVQDFNPVADDYYGLTNSDYTNYAMYSGEPSVDYADSNIGSILT